MLNFLKTLESFVYKCEEVNYKHYYAYLQDESELRKLEKVYIYLGLFLVFHKFSCRKCKAIDSPLNNTITKLTTGRGGCIVAFGICKAYGHEMQHPYKKAEEAKMREIFTIQLEQQTTLYNTSSSTKTAHIEMWQKEVVSELSESIVLENHNTTKVLRFPLKPLIFHNNNHFFLIYEHNRHSLQ